MQQFIIENNCNHKGELVTTPKLRSVLKHKLQSPTKGTGCTPLKKKIDANEALVDELIDALDESDKENDSKPISSY